ncbi:hypothetical protein [uncultured Campylobacter sp.]|uniref:hypothetical protein n=1 Tax=uncultured Campylobacter sp. TaxID=218934 RepID=UPI00261E6C5E|nr:hypothetical protein [uncultured Campylobacter sp.]
MLAAKFQKQHYDDELILKPHCLALLNLCSAHDTNASRTKHIDERLYPRRKRLKFYQSSQKARRKFKEFKFESELRLSAR